ncbi:MAG: hypothetical protein Q4G07_11225 [Oscillospiraceae bacterium]|nr:hypothetical protein [Oscillospiraceae bacterium]
MEKYIVTKEKFEYPDIGSYESYGIKRMNGSNLTLQDISADQAFVSHLAHEMNEGEVDDIHMFDIVIDAIS